MENKLESENKSQAERKASALERDLVQWLLRGGLALACALMAIGFLVQLITGSMETRTFLPEQIFSEATPPGERLMGAGVLVLAMTPAVRVLALLFLWTREKDWRFVGVAVAVVITLSAALVLGG